MPTAVTAWSLGRGATPARCSQGSGLEDIIASGFWNDELFNNLQYYWQTSLMQPVGGMDMIWKGFLEQPVPPESIPPDMKWEKPPTVEALVTLSSPVTAIRNTPNGVEVQHGNNVLHTADFCVSTMAPIQLAQVGRGLSTAFVNALADITYVPACKVGWQTRRRFWETDDGIYGGISWTKHIISQIWYPSSGYQSETGVLTATYNRGDSALVFGDYPLEKRFDLALEGGERLHPGTYRQHVMRETALGIAWQHMPYFIGGWPNETFQERPESYNRLVSLNPEGRIYLAGDYLSYWPGWQEGALGAANWAYKMIRERVRQ